MARLDILENSAVVLPEGDIVASTVPLLKEKLKEAIETGLSDLTVDMSGIRMIDSIGIAVLIATQNTLEGRSGKLKLANVDAEIFSLMKLMRLDQHMEIFAA